MLASRQFCIRNQVGLVGLFGRLGLSIFQILILKYGRSIFGDSLNASLLLFLFGLLLLSNPKKIPCPYGVSTNMVSLWCFNTLKFSARDDSLCNESFIEAFLIIEFTANPEILVWY